MRSYESIREWLIKRAEVVSVRQIARDTGLNHAAIHRLMDGTVSNPRIDTLSKIEALMGPENDNVAYIRGTEFVAIVADEVENTINIKTNISNKDQALALVVVAACRYSIGENVTRNMLVGMVSSTYEAIKKQDKKVG
ncbi:helix-turn-helix domain-containing protein [Sphaerochaeta globosa]|uniref:HTH cro/C1-type domain-containing protein n=1 Tax=Sphaerochaeta globosa (strain ATCC BAA-1886 / DSM 22777 / Buddy) TaxID=158189 RepID=F0RWM0_SPHGB|nr:helix-turn-helix transcriptional regulator [Sphaerochaeta globosa]ADY13651.1 hypothetical protein SpiBuddy_1827 [Sphaerochaeta globosa str. Buddy]